MLAKHFGKIEGIDVSSEAISECNRNYKIPNVNFQVFDPNKQPFPDASFDFIGSFQVFELMQPPILSGMSGRCQGLAEAQS